MPLQICNDIYFEHKDFVNPFVTRQEEALEFFGVRLKLQEVGLLSILAQGIERVDQSLDQSISLRLTSFQLIANVL